MSDVLHLTGAFCLHQLHCEPKKSPGLVRDHLEVILFCWAGQGVSPKEIHALAAVEVAELVGVYLYCFGIVKL